MGQCQPVAVGTRWIEYGAQAYHVVPVYYLVSTTTGAVKPVEKGSPSLDLNAQNPFRKRCRALAAGATTTTRFIGSRAIVFSPSHQYLGRGSYTIAQCHSTKRIRLRNQALLGTGDARLAYNHKLIAWYSGLGSAVHGLNASTGRRFTIKLPKSVTGIGDVRTLALTAKSLYVGLQNASDSVATARIPGPLR